MVVYILSYLPEFVFFLLQFSLLKKKRKEVLESCEKIVLIYLGTGKIKG